MRSFKKTVLTIFCCTVMVFNMFPPSAFAVQPDLTFSAGFSEPYVSDNSFYIEVLMQSVADPSVYNVHVYHISYVIKYDGTPSSSVDIVTPLYPVFERRKRSVDGVSIEEFNVVLYPVADHVVDAFYSVTDYSVNYNTVTYMKRTSYSGGFDTILSLTSSDNWNIVGVNCKGISLNNVSGSSWVPPMTFLVNYSNSNDTFAKIQEIINQLYVLHQDNIDQVDKLVEIINGVIQLHSDNLEILEEFATLLSDIADIKQILDLITNYLTVDQLYLLWELDYELIGVNEKLNVLIDLLQPDTDVNVSTVDPSNFNEYNKAEQSLLDTSNVDVSGAMNVEINQQALLYIWPLLENCLNTNPKVIGLTFTILAISLVALILGRKGG